MYGKEEISKRLAEFIKQKRRVKKITQEELATKAEIDYKHAQRLESTKFVNDPRLSTLIKLAKAFEVKVNEIIKYLLK